MALGIIDDPLQTDAPLPPVSNVNVPEGMTYREYLILHGISTSSEPGLTARSNPIKRDKLGRLEQPLLRFIYGPERLQILDQQLPEEHREVVRQIYVLLNG